MRERGGEHLKARIYGELEALLREKDLDRVTVRELAGRCGVSRQGFYYHFPDLIGVLEWRASQLIARGIRHSLESCSIEEPLAGMVRTLKEHYAILRNVLSSARSRDALQRILIGALRDNLRPILSRHAGTNALSPGQRELLLTFLAYGVAGLILERAGEEDFSPEAVAHDIRLLLDARLPGI